MNKPKGTLREDLKGDLNKAHLRETQGYYTLFFIETDNWILSKK